MLPAAVPQRAETLQVLRLISKCEPILMLGDDADGYGTRWTIAGQQVQPAIARYLMESGFVCATGKTEFGATKLGLSDQGSLFREKGLAWWADLNMLQKLKVVLFG